MKTNSYTADDIHCRGCEGTIRTLVGDIEGVHDVEPDHQTNRVLVTYDEAQVEETAIRDSLTNIGFPPAVRIGEVADRLAVDPKTIR